MKHRTVNDLVPIRYHLESDPKDTRQQTSIYVERVMKQDGTTLWAIRNPRFELAFSCEDKWYLEPSPSNRTDLYLSLCRFDSLQDALDAWEDSETKRRYQAGEPTEFYEYDED